MACAPSPSASEPRGVRADCRRLGGALGLIAGVRIRSVMAVVGVKLGGAAVAVGPQVKAQRLPLLGRVFRRADRVAECVLGQQVDRLRSIDNRLPNAGARRPAVDDAAGITSGPIQIVQIIDERLGVARRGVLFLEQQHVDRPGDAVDLFLTDRPQNDFQIGVNRTGRVVGHDPQLGVRHCG